MNNREMTRRLEGWDEGAGREKNVFVVAVTDMEEGEVGHIVGIDWSNMLNAIQISVAGADHAEEDDDAED